MRRQSVLLIWLVMLTMVAFRVQAFRLRPSRGLFALGTQYLSARSARGPEAGEAGPSRGDNHPKSTPKLLKLVRSNGDGKSGSSDGSSRNNPKVKSSSGQRPRSNGDEQGNFVTVRLGTERDEENADMDERMRDARNWVSKKLSDEESAMLNRAMGIEAEVLAALDSNDSDDDKFGGRGGGGKAQPRGGKRAKEGYSSSSNTQSSRVRRMQELSAEETRAAAQIRGFLELNPYLCSGCGAPFQSKASDAPGFLPPEKLQEHRQRSTLIRDRQEAVRVLELAGLELGSAAAEELLRGAKVGEDVIAGVQALGGGRSANSQRRRLDVDDDDDDEGNNDDDEDDDAEGEDDPLDGLEIDIEGLLGGGAGVRAEGSGQGTDGGEETLAKALAMQISQAQAQAQAQAKTRINKRPAMTNSVDANGLPSAAAVAAALRQKERKGQGMLNEAEATAAVDAAAPGVGVLEPVCICQRCFRLQQYGQVEPSLRPGWSQHELLTPSRFEQLLGVVKESDAVVLCLVDLFDLQGSLLKNLRNIAGHNPIVVAANKLDLLPRDASANRLGSWVHAEIKRVCGLSSPRDAEQESYETARDRGFRTAKDDRLAEAGVLRRQNVHLISSATGAGVAKLLGSVLDLARLHGNKVYVMGAANVGKSSFINRLLDFDGSSGSGSGSRGGSGGVRGAKKPRSSVPQATVSNLPGTTLDFLKIRLPNGITVIDTPGLLNEGQLTARLSTDELRAVVPAKPVNAVTLRLTEGKCVLLGGLARVELTQGRPFFFTFFVSNDVKLHPTDAIKADDFLSRHVGTLVTPPSSPERLGELGPTTIHTFDITGDDWKTAQTDIVIAGLGWVSVTGPGSCTVSVTALEGVSVSLRPALLPYEASHSTARFTGGRIEKKSRKPSGGSGQRA